MLPTCARSVRASQGSEASFMQFGNSKFCRGNRSIFSICSGNTLLLLGWLCLVVALSGNLLSQSNANWITIHSSGSYYVTFGLWQKHTKPPAGNLYDLRKADFKDFVLNKKVYGEKAEEKQEVGTIVAELSAERGGAFLMTTSIQIRTGIQAFPTFPQVQKVVEAVEGSTLWGSAA
eukprot:Nk52_evm78s745 gene=Nk52_evmTU78s745